MPLPPATVAIAIGLLVSALALPGHAVAQAPAPPAVDPTTASATPAQIQALVAFRPHAEQVCRALYLRPEAAATCVERLLDAALPLAMETTEPQPPSVAPPAASRATTVAPDGRE
jgi:hypothetical protein